MRKMPRGGVLLIAVIALAGCAALRGQPTHRTSKQCSDTPRNAIVRFLQGIIVLSTEPIRMVIAEGMTALGIFAEGDEAKGYHIVRQLYRHPEVVDEKSDVAIYTLEPVEFADMGNGETRVLLRRIDEVTPHVPPAPRDGREPPPLPGIQKTFQRNFAVRFQPGSNCISAVRPLEPGWTRVQ